MRLILIGFFLLFILFQCSSAISVNLIQPPPDALKAGQSITIHTQVSIPNGFPQDHYIEIESNLLSLNCDAVMIIPDTNYHQEVQIVKDRIGNYQIFGWVIEGIQSLEVVCSGTVPNSQSITLLKITEKDNSGPLPGGYNLKGEVEGQPTTIPPTTSATTHPTTQTTLTQTTITSTYTQITSTPTTVVTTETQSINEILEEQNRRLEEQNRLLEEQNKQLEEQKNILQQLIDFFRALFGWNPTNST